MDGLLLVTIRARFVWHVLGEGGIRRHIIETALVWKGARGRQGKKMLDWIKRRSGFQDDMQLGALAKDRDQWRR